ncbi:MAG: lysophospholipid acyltransferase family protein [Gemmatimonadota bacterium]
MIDRVRLSRIVGPPLLRGLAATWRIRETNEQGIVGPPRPRLEPAIHALWHSELLPLMMCYAPAGMATMISHHADGEIAAGVVRALGSRVVRGSSSSGGGAALAEMVRLGREGWPLAITPDGPRGPARRCKPGVVRLAAESGLPIVPVAACPESGWRLKSWDRFIVPRPFTSIDVEFARPIRVPEDAPETDLGGWLDRVEAALTAASERCAARAAGEEAAA